MCWTPMLVTSHRLCPTQIAGSCAPCPAGSGESRHDPSHLRCDRLLRRDRDRRGSRSVASDRAAGGHGRDVFGTDCAVRPVDVQELGKRTAPSDRGCLGLGPDRLRDVFVPGSIRAADGERAARFAAGAGECGRYDGADSDGWKCRFPEPRRGDRVGSVRGKEPAVPGLHHKPSRQGKARCPTLTLISRWLAPHICCRG